MDTKVENKEEVLLELPFKKQPCIYINEVEFKKPYVHLVYKNPQENQQGMIPLKRSHMECLISDGLATMNLKFEFVNEHTENPVETTLEFPCEKKTIITKVLASIDERIVEAKVEKKEKATQKYDDAVASGHTPTMVEKKKDVDGFTLRLGNLHPGKVATVDIQLSKYLEIEQGAYVFRMPTNYFPDYSVIKKLEQDIPVPKYSISYKLEVKSFKPITYLSVPEGCKTEELIQQKHVIVTSSEDSKVPKRDQMLYFKTSDMGIPNLKAQISEKHPDEVALLASFVPTFEQKQPQESIELFEDEVPDQSPLNPDEKVCFIFLIDRSGSMWGDRIETAKNALTLFLKSLPSGSTFQVTSFGSRYSNLNPSPMEYNNDNLTSALNQITHFGADFGGTDIYKPLQNITQVMVVPQNFVKRVFVLTDGQVGNTNECIELARQNSQQARVHTFGIGNDCDKRLVEGMAKAGRGTANFASDRTNDLRSLVIQALKQACEPSLKECTISWNGERPLPYGEVFRNELITTTQIIKKDMLKDAKFRFTSKEDPVTKGPVNIEFTEKDFEMVAEDDYIFKHAAQTMMKNQSVAKIIELSTKYQILCDHTAMIAVVKQKEKTTGEMKEFSIPMGQKIEHRVPAPVIPPQPVYSQPQYNQPSYKQQFYMQAQPMLAQQMQAQPMMAQQMQPVYSQPQYNQPSYQQQSYMQAQPMMAQQMQAQPMMAQQMQAQPMMAQQMQTQPIMAQVQQSQGMLGQLFGNASKARAQSPPKQSYDLFTSMKSAQCAMQSMNKQADLDDLMDLQDEMCLEQESNEKAQFFAEACMNNDDELMAELDELEAEECMADMASNDLLCMAPSAAIQAPQQSMQLEANNEDKLLEMMMLGEDTSLYKRKESEKKKKVNKMNMEEEKMKVEAEAIKQAEMKRQEEEMKIKEEAMKRSEMKKQDPKTPAPSFDQLINQQDSNGNWNNSCGSMLAQFFNDQSIEDKQLLDQLTALNSALYTQIWHTIIALFILEEKFEDTADEWEMIARKAKTWLKQNGVAQPNSFIKKISFSLK